MQESVAGGGGSTGAPASPADPDSVQVDIGEALALKVSGRTQCRARRER